MAAFLSSQLDFIFFFYGLAFIILGGVCFAIRRHSEQKTMWALLGAFGLVHGASEWFDLTALVLGDSTAFAIFRTAVMIVSFMFLLEFARLGARQLGLLTPGRWIHFVFLALCLAGGLSDGLAEANALARYSFGLVGSLGSSLVFAKHAQELKGSHRRLALSASAALVCYGIAAGLIVPAAPIWPANVLNYAWFTELTGMPIQLVRGLLACWVAIAVWGIWGERVVQTISTTVYTRHLKQLFAATLTTIGVILVLGWVLTEYLGDIYKMNIEREANSEIDLVASYLTGEITTTEGITQATARAPSIQAYFSGDRIEEDEVTKLLAMNIAAVRAEGGLIADRKGNVAAAFGEPHAIGMAKTEILNETLRGQSTHRFHYVPASDATFFYASEPIRNAENGEILGAVILERSLGGFAKNLMSLDKPFALVDPAGTVVLTNQPTWHLRLLWPPDAAAPNSRQIVSTPLPAKIEGPSWIKFEGSRAFAQRRFIEDSQWSIVMLTTAPGIFASRVLGIVVTLMATGMVLVYLTGRERHIFDRFQMDQRLALEELARDLRFQATTDPLTGLSNRLKLNHQLDLELARASRYGAPVSFILYDIDRFKDVNDNYGHPAGDEVLLELSRLASSCIRKTDLLARWGGEEFAIVVPHTKLDKAVELANALRATVEAHSFGQVGSLSCSFGVTEYRPGDTAETLVARADAALYVAKMAGRNRVEALPQASVSVDRVA